MSVKRYQFTIPGADQFSQPIKVRGCSILIEDAPEYSSPDNVPELFFNQKGIPGSGAPIYSKAQLNNGDEGFTSLFLYGTPESAGDTIYILVIENEILTTDIDPATTAPGGQEISDTLRIASTDSSQLLPNSLKYDDGTVSGKPAKSIFITNQGNSVRYAFGSTIPDQTDQGHLLEAGDEIELIGFAYINTFKFISATAATPGALNFTSEF